MASSTAGENIASHLCFVFFCLTCSALFFSECGLYSELSGKKKKQFLFF